LEWSADYSAEQSQKHNFETGLHDTLVKALKVLEGALQTSSEALETIISQLIESVVKTPGTLFSSDF
jgi:hypothetical protein